MTGSSRIALLGGGHPRYRLFLLVLVIAATALNAVIKFDLALLVGFDVAVLAFILSCVGLWRRGDAEAMRIEAHRDDGNQLLLLMLTALISMVVLTALGMLILDKKGLDARHIVLLVSTLMASWTFANMVYAFHYARLYYSVRDSGDHAGLDFPGDQLPVFADFVNFAFVIGMTCQTADIDITDQAMRRISTFQGLFAFAFNLGILALTVNVLASS
jgi:uncharacterized membrane protein